MHKCRRLAVIIVCLTALAITGCGQQQKIDTAAADNPFPVPQIEYAPEQYVCYRTTEAITVDGRLDETAWQDAAATELFVDIEGDTKARPRFDTRAKMLFDSSYFYIGAFLHEPHVWGTLIERDAVIYHDNDFEVFIDPNHDTHEYYEFEINALATPWDLLLVKPYRDGGPAINAWDIAGLKSKVHVYGTLNNPGDIDSGWSVEIAIPWRVLAECAHKPSPPADGDQWAVNFSRVEWRHEVRDNGYVKQIDPATGRPLSEDNWVWSPQGLINMHYPEMWGLVQFSYETAGDGAVAFQAEPEQAARWALRRLYYGQREYHRRYGSYASNISNLNLTDIPLPGYTWPPAIDVTSHGFEASIADSAGTANLIITHDGRLHRHILETAD